MVGGSHSLLVDVTTALLSRIPEGKRRAVRKTLRPLRSVLTNKSKASPEIPLLRRLEQIKTDVENIRVPLGKPQSSDFSFQPNASWNAKQRSLHQILGKPRSVLDIASGSGWFSGLAQFSDAVATRDIDLAAVAHLFVPAAPAICPFAFGYGLHATIASAGLANHSHIAATDRFPCETVLMLDFLHHLVFTTGG
jgi:hypothetical protein